MNLDELETALRTEEVQLQIVRDTGMYAVALLAVIDTIQGERLELAGSGTLIEASGSHYVLTARHVWEERLTGAAKLGITLTEGLDHRFLLDVQIIVAIGPPRPDQWGEWGPDLVFLRIPPEHVGTIKARRVFYRQIEQNVPQVDRLGTRLLLGAPAELGEFTGTRAQLQITGLFTDIDAPVHVHGDFDYIDLTVDTTAPGTPQCYGGVSAGGLWTVQAFESPSRRGQIDSIAALEGVAFYQSGIENGRRIIRCHGPGSIRAAMPQRA